MARRERQARDVARRRRAGDPGIVLRVEPHGYVRDGTIVMIEIGPALALLAHTRRCRVFEQIDACALAQLVCAPLLGEFGRALDIGGVARPPRRDYCVQYDETDLAFVRRVLAEDGLVIAFRHDDDPERELAVVVDDPGALGSVGSFGWLGRARRARLRRRSVRSAVASHLRARACGGRALGLDGAAVRHHRRRRASRPGECDAGRTAAARGPSRIRAERARAGRRPRGASRSTAARRRRPQRGVRRPIEHLAARPRSCLRAGRRRGRERGPLARGGGAARLGLSRARRRCPRPRRRGLS